MDRRLSINRQLKKIDMKPRIFSFVLASFCLLVGAVGPAFAQGTAFTYDGRLNSGANPATGSYDLKFTLYSDANLAAIVGTPITNSAVGVTNGLFTQILDFGTTGFGSSPRWLEVGVRTNGSASAFTTLSPRQQITAAPFAILATTAGNASFAGTASSVSANAVTAAGIQNATITAAKVATGQVVKSLNGFADNVILSAGANVTLTTNGNGLQIAYAGGIGGNSNNYVAKAGDTMTGILNLAAPATANFGGITRQMLNLYNTAYGIGVQNFTLYERTAINGGYAWYAGGVHSDNPNDPGSGGVSLMTLDSYGDLIATGAITANQGLYGTSVGGSLSSGVSGYDTGGFNNATGVYGSSTVGTGVSGSGGNKGVYGITSSAGPTHAGVFGENSAVGGTALAINSAGVAGVADTAGSTGVYGRGNLWAGFFDGNVNVNGTLTTKILTIAGADLAEPFAIAESALPRGTVVVIDGKRLGGLKRSTKAYDTGVAGIVSGANGINSGIILSQPGVNEGGQNVALSGRVYVLADATGNPILPGDLLTTSSIPGHAMKAVNHTKAVGAVIGKAMSPLPQGRGMVLVLVTLQ